MERKENVLDSTEFKKESRKIDFIYYLTILIAIGVLVYLFVNDYTFRLQMSVVSGALVGLLNLWLIKKMVLFMIFGSVQKGRSVFKGVLKFLLLAIAAGVLIFSFKVNVLGLALGFSCMVLSIILVGLFSYIVR